ncbi:MAG: ATP-binding protein [Gemmatimonadaceae bacterium]
MHDVNESQPATDQKARAGSHSVVVENVWTLLASFAAVCYGLFVARTGGEVAMVWPASAVALAAIVLRGWKLFPGIAFGTFLGAWLDGRSTAIAALLVLPLAVELAVATAVLRRAKLVVRFTSADDSIRLAWIAAVASTCGAAAGVAILTALGTLRPSAAPMAFLSWALGDAIGILAFSPALLLWLGRRPPVRRPGRAELASMLLAAAAVSGFVLVTYALGSGNRMVTMWLALFPLLLWTSLRAEVRVAAAIVVVLSIAGTIGVSLGTGALVSPSGSNVLNVQAFHVMMVLMVLAGAASISEREDALLQSRDVERKLALVFQGTRDVHTLYEIGTDGEQRVVMANENWTSVLKKWRPGLTDEDFFGHTPEEIRALLGVHPDDAAVHMERMRTAIDTGAVIDYEVETPSPDGLRLVETTLVPMREGNRTRYLLATARDVTQARTSERRLRESEVRFAAVSDATHEVQLLFAVDGASTMRLVHLNRAAREVWERFWPGTTDLDILGLPAEQVIRGLPGFTEAQFQRNLAFAREAITTRQVQRFEDQIVTPAGRRFAEVAIIPISSESGAVTHVLRSSTDISDRKAAEESARRFNEALERRVEERTAQLAMANRELEAFGYSLSHDLRAPLRSVEGFSRALLEDLEHGSPNESRDHARRIHGAALRMKALVDDLLRLSQLSTTDLQRSPIDLSAMASEILRGLASGDAERWVRTTVHPNLTATADERLVSIALQNLLDNAWKYTSRRDTACIEVGQAREDGVVATFVRDNGVGFDPRYAERLFSPFQRLHKSDEFEGAGVGLATVHRIVAAHGGRVWAESAPEAGATFYFTLEHG